MRQRSLVVNMFLVNKINYLIRKFIVKFFLGVPDELWEQLKEAGRSQTNHLYSNRTWPVDGGSLLCSKGSEPRREILLTGHEDGTVRFWDAGSVTLTPIYKFSTAQLFTGDDIVGKMQNIYEYINYNK